MGNYFLDGILHITDIEGYDHMLFLLALCAPFTFKDRKRVAILATAFTVGHSISLALAAFDIIRFSSTLIEFLIPITIMATAAMNFNLKDSADTSLFSYSSAAVFGIIHGMGFSSYFRMISTEGENFIAQLLLFNLGVEVGQLLIVAVILSVIALVVLAIPSAYTGKTRFLSVLAFLLALALAIEKYPG